MKLEFLVEGVIFYNSKIFLIRIEKWARGKNYQPFRAKNSRPRTSINFRPSRQRPKRT